MADGNANYQSNFAISNTIGFKFVHINSIYQYFKGCLKKHYQRKYFWNVKKCGVTWHN